MTHQQAVPSAPPPNYQATEFQPPAGQIPVQPQLMPQQIDGVCKEWIPYNMPGSAQLGYIDVQPRCLDPGNFELKKPPVFESFSNTIQVANAWLMNHPNVAVLKCETTERRLQKFHFSEDQIITVPMSHVNAVPVSQNNTYPGVQGRGHGGKTQTLTYDIDSLLKHEARQGLQSYVKGLRVWLRDKPGDSQPQQIGMFDTVPDEETVDMPPGNNSDSFFVQGEKVMSYVARVMNYKHHITFKGLQATVDKLNKTLEKHPLPGEIISLELVTFRRQFEDSVSRDLDPNQSGFMVDLNRVSRYTKILRLFYVIGTPSRDPLGLYALVPEVTKLPGPNSMMGRPQFQKESQLYASLAAWLGQNQGVIIKSIIQTSIRYYYQQAADRVFIASDSMDDVSEPDREYSVLNARLIFYTWPSSGYVTPITCLTSRVFLPLRTSLKSYENMNQTMERINAWLRITGLPVYHLETLEMLYTENDRQGVNTEKTDYTVRPSFGFCFVVAYKLYFTTLYQEPDPRTQPATIDWMTQGESTTCSIL